MSLFISCLLFGFAATVISVIKFMHMFQLNSYKPKVQLKWMLINLNKLGSNIFLLFWGGIIYSRPNNAVLYALIVLFSLFIWLNRPKKAKKPLVYTPRVNRMLTTIFILTVLAYLYAAYSPVSSKYFIICLVYFAAPLLVLIANFINAPVEAAVRRHYINDAKRILKSCPNLTVIGITGSYGKTSVKFYLNTLLRAKFNTLMTPESFNTPMGVVKTIREQLKSTHEIFVCEMGAKQKHDIKEICDIVNPKHGIITSLGPQHLESFKSIENVINTKYELACALPQDGMLFINGDNEIIKANLPKRKHITYGTKKGNDYQASNIKLSSKGTLFTIKTPTGESDDFQTVLIGEHNIVNLTGAIAMSHSLGISLAELKPQIKKITAVPHRLQLIESSAALIIDDAYNSNPSGAKAALKTLSLFEDYKIMITPGMIELGSKQTECNYDFGKEAAKVCDYIILVGEKQTAPIYKGIVSAKFPKENIYVANNIKEALNKAYSIQTERKKVILLENDLPDNY